MSIPFSTQYTAPSSAAAAHPAPGTVQDANKGGGGVATYNEATIDDASALQYLIAWGLVLLLILILNRSRWGHNLIYYGLALSLLLLVLVNYQAITALLAPATQNNAGDDAAEPAAPVDTGTGAGAGQEPLGPSDPTSPVNARAPKFQTALDH
jgi:hypothetical protein